MDTLHVGDYLCEFITALKDAVTEFEALDANINNEDKTTQDLLHLLELGDLKCDDRSKVATQLARNRQNRRYYKDRREELEPLYNFYRENQKFFNKLDNVLCQVRKREKAHVDRIYKPRVVDISSLLPKK